MSLTKSSSGLNFSKPRENFTKRDFLTMAKAIMQQNQKMWIRAMLRMAEFLICDKDIKQIYLDDFFFNMFAKTVWHVEQIGVNLQKIERQTLQTKPTSTNCLWQKQAAL